MNRGRTRQGFTLLEMLVALAIMGVLATALCTCLHVAFRARRRAEAALAPANALTLTLDLVRRHIESALPPTGVLAGAFVGEDETAESSGADADILTFFTTVGDAAASQCDIRKVELILIESDEGDGHNLALRTTTNLLAPETPDPTEEILCRRVESLNLSYFDGSDCCDSWDSTTRDNALPLGVEVTLELMGQDDADEDDSDEDSSHSVTQVFSLPCAAAQSESSGPRGLGLSL